MKMSKPSVKRAVILLADDDEDDYLLIRDAFKQRYPEEVDLVWVQDGEALMDYLLRCYDDTASPAEPCPNLLLLDLNMPRKNGREALREIKQNAQFNYLPVLAISESAGADDVYLTYRLGAASMVAKPTGFPKYLQFVQSIHDYWFKTVILP